MALKRSESLNSVTSYSHEQGDAALTLSAELSKLIMTAPLNLRDEVERNCKGFQTLFDQYMGERGTKISWDKIRPPPAGSIVPHATVAAGEPKAASELSVPLSKLAVLKLNGGLGTSMGCVGPKSVISVRNDLTFLDLCVRQIEHLNDSYGTTVPLVLMNSFNTHDDTQKVLRKYKKTEVKVFNQSQYPRILKETLQPLPKNTDNSDEDWYPPGHGDLYRSFYDSGLLQELLDDGKEWVFISNIDNLGATVDEDILRYVTRPGNDCEFVMEVTDKTRADVKGGTLIEYEGRIRLLEVAQVPKDHEEDFKSVTKFRVFNTNNLWINLHAIKRLVEEESLHMEVIENKKTLDDGRVIIQLEQAVGSAIKNFNGAIGINVPRSRFLPVKKTSDLLLVMSNLYQLRHGTLSMNASRLFDSVPLIKLGDHFKKVKDFLRRFENIPDILELDHLTVSGDVKFGKNVILRGTVIIIAQENDSIDIPQGSVLENKIVTGNLRILDH
ncbi:uncharacterized protein MONBRDRAFT_38883 [Monosiga brevicollis MX1]|uniref:UTP--glucose-1-phosphate uridylyltransferase n=1 Tax=Monosiga brevicollis TaxID=81824 RepID=A9VAS8_MONBE|nr:uncharacterized protein MONBRDRAFT_38883 [Monosiga brevicollis MX1]EDQ85373.1 predicted protein [Monosiga brevicollis MX1]|eukprot:XP_001749784.1 hypothetical protein [Monosiga brevicollis MX1]